VEDGIAAVMVEVHVMMIEAGVEAELVEANLALLIPQHPSNAQQHLCAARPLPGFPIEVEHSNIPEPPREGASAVAHLNNPCRTGRITSRNRSEPRTDAKVLHSRTEVWKRPRPINLVSKVVNKLERQPQLHNLPQCFCVDEQPNARRTAASPGSTSPGVI
jgi:hypothetical protein